MSTAYKWLDPQPGNLSDWAISTTDSEPEAPVQYSSGAVEIENETKNLAAFAYLSRESIETISSSSGELPSVLNSGGVKAPKADRWPSRVGPRLRRSHPGQESHDTASLWLGSTVRLCSNQIHHGLFSDRRGICSWDRAAFIRHRCKQDPDPIRTASVGRKPDT